MEIFCPNKNSNSFKELVKELGGEELAYSAHMKQEYDNNPNFIRQEAENERLKKGFDKDTREIYVYFKRRLIRLKKEVLTKNPQSEQAIKLQEEITKLTNKLEEVKKTQSKTPYLELGNLLLKNIDSYLNELKSGKIEPKIKDINYTREVLSVFNDFTGLDTDPRDLYKELLPFINDFTEKIVNEFSTEDKELTIEDIQDQNKDINRFRKGVGALSDVADYIGRTIGSLIKSTQNKIATTNKQLTKEVQEQVDDLREYSKKNGIPATKIYEPFIQELYGTTVLTKEYTSDYYNQRNKAFKDTQSKDPKIVSEGKKWLKENTVWTEDGRPVPSKNIYYNPNYKKIQNTPALKKFYDFHQKITEEAIKKLPVEIGSDFIANIKSTITSDILNGNKKILSGLKEGLKNIITTKESSVGEFLTNDDLAADVVPTKYIHKIAAGDKSRDLGESLLKFGAFANSYQEMSEILPQARLLQEEIKRKDYIKSSSPSEFVNGEDSNIFKMVNTVIDQQIKGITKLEEGKISLGKTYDENGNLTKEKYVLTSDLVDFGLKYNSLLKIGFSIPNAVNNVIIGDIGNIIEGFGGRFYNLRDLSIASNIFAKQNFNKKSDLYKLLEELNPLQELDDYSSVNEVRIKGKISKEGIENILYKPQQMGEKWLQTRTMLATLYHDELIDKNGKPTAKYDSLTEEQKAKLSDKIQRLNQSIHGRYSSRDAATLQQNAIFRLISQFRKWIPSALESRLGDYQYDNRLQTTIEGRYKTGFRLMVTDLADTIKRLQSGKLTKLEVYNMRKNLLEVLLLTATLLTYNGFKGDKDDKEWRKKPGVKFGLDQLNRASGDLLFFYSPGEYNRLAQNAIPLSKTVGDILSVVKYTPYLFYDAGKNEKYTSGPRKGENKLYSRFASLIPGFKPITDIQRSLNDNEFQDLTK